MLGHAEDVPESRRRVITIENFQSGVSRLHDSRVIGFVRFQRSMHLDRADFALLKECPALVCLVIRQDAAKRLTGGFFYRDGDKIAYPAEALQFPLAAKVENEYLRALTPVERPHAAPIEPVPAAMRP